MDSIFQNNAVASIPERPAGLKSVGHPTNGSKSGGLPATDIGAWWYFMVTQEIVNAIKGAGLDPNGDYVDQLNTAIEARIKKAKDEIMRQVDTVAQSLTESGIPTGMVLPFAGTKVPDRFYLCNGDAKDRAGDAKLFAAIGTAYGSGNGSTTFNIPNYINRVMWGAATGIGEYLKPALPNITGYIGMDDMYRYHIGGAFFWDGFNNQSTGTRYTEQGYTYKFDASRANPIYGREDTVRPPAVKTMFCIRR